MSKSETSIPEDEAFKTKVASELDKAKQFARSLNFADVKSGEWFSQLLRKVIQTYDRNARAAYFQQKYPGVCKQRLSGKLSKRRSLR